jgi:protein phosphatase
MDFTLHIDGLTDIGNSRRNNEDAWWAGQLGGRHLFMAAGPAPLALRLPGAPVLLLVSDGVGGANAGEVASQMAIQRITAELARTAGAWAEPGLEGMGATLSLLCFASPGTAGWGQAGDSRLYLCRQGRLRQLSHDQSPVGRMRQRGEITEAEARLHPLRHQIDQGLGDPVATFQPEIGCETPQPGDVFLLCSDGLSDGLWDHQIAQTLAAVRRPPHVRPAVHLLVAQAKQTSGKDNITAVLALVEGPPFAAAV